MAVLLTKFPPEALLIAMPETLPPVGAADGQRFLRERAVISLRGHRQGRVGMCRIRAPPGQAAAWGSSCVSAGALESPATMLEVPLLFWAGWCSLLPASCRAVEQLTRSSGCRAPSLPDYI